MWFDSLLKIAVSEAFLNEMESLPSKEELDQLYIPSDGLSRRMKKIVNQNRMKQKIHTYVKIIRKIAAVAVILFTVSSFTLLSVEATRNAIFKLIIKHHDKYTEIRFDETDVGRSKDALYYPTYLPQDFTETETVTYGNTVMLTFANGEGLEILLKQSPAATGTTFIDNENTEYKEVDINGNIAYLFEGHSKDDYNVLLWQADGVVFELTSRISSDELIRIGCSLSK